jgi:hypothetical protein
MGSIDFFSVPTIRLHAIEVLASDSRSQCLNANGPRAGSTDVSATLRRTWPRWTEVLVIFKPETVTGWRRAGFRLYLRWRSRPRGGRPQISEEIRELIRR